MQVELDIRLTSFHINNSNDTYLIQVLAQKHLMSLSAIIYPRNYRGCNGVIVILTVLSGSHLITMSSTAGLCGRPNISAYCATKYALNGFTEAFHVEEVVDKGQTEVPKLILMNPYVHCSVVGGQLWTRAHTCKNSHSG